jgi:hypothetical protein
VSEWLFFNANLAILQLCQGENKLIWRYIHNNKHVYENGLKFPDLKLMSFSFVAKQYIIHWYVWNLCRCLPNKYVGNCIEEKCKITEKLKTIHIFLILFWISFLSFLRSLYCLSFFYVRFRFRLFLWLVTIQRSQN